jgi:hypothetical protein
MVNVARLVSVFFGLIGFGISVWIVMRVWAPAPAIAFAALVISFVVNVIAAAIFGEHFLRYLLNKKQ